MQPQSLASLLAHRALQKDLGLHISQGCTKHPSNVHTAPAVNYLLSSSNIQAAKRHIRLAICLVLLRRDDDRHSTEHAQLQGQRDWLQILLILDAIQAVDALHHQTVRL